MVRAAAARRAYNPVVPPSPQTRIPGPLERTALEIRRLHGMAAFSRRRSSRSRQLLRESDALLELVEECRVRGYQLLPADVHTGVVRLIRRVDRGLRDELGINRQPDHVSDILFSAQQLLLEQARDDLHPALAPIIPLFPEGPSADRCTG